MKNNFIALLDQAYPGVNSLFDSPICEDGSQKWVDFAAAFWHVDRVRSMRLVPILSVTEGGANGMATTSARTAPLKSTWMPRI